MKRYDPPVLGVDISKWQNVVGTNYEYPVFCARAHSGYSVDPRFVLNRSRIDVNAGVKVRAAYVVPVAGMDPNTCVRQTMNVLTAGWCVMIDEESGAGFHGPGNHSAYNNDLRERFIKALGGNRRMVWGYANTGDWQNNWPDRGDTPMVVAKYSANDNDLIRSDQVFGWQYSNGQTSNGVPDGWPRSSRAVGNCDMNVYGFPTGDAFAAWLGGHAASGGTATPLSEEDELNADQNNALTEILNKVRDLDSAQAAMQQRADTMEQTSKAVRGDVLPVVQQLTQTVSDLSARVQALRTELAAKPQA